MQLFLKLCKKEKPAMSDNWLFALSYETFNIGLEKLKERTSKYLYYNRTKRNLK